jgi:hypothetical protein
MIQRVLHLGASIAFLIFLISPLCTAEERLFSSAEISSENGIRTVIQTAGPLLSAVFYYFDGYQIFGIFRRSDSNDHLLVIMPQGPLENFEIRAGRTKLEGPFQSFTVAVAKEVVQPNGEVKVTKNLSHREPLGIWIQFEDSQEVAVSGEIHGSISQQKWVWKFSATRDKSGVWRSRLNRLEN